MCLRLSRWAWCTGGRVGMDWVAQWLEGESEPEREAPGEPC